jgi:hypothetical protein
MVKTKKLGKGLEEISHVFISSAEREIVQEEKKPATAQNLSKKICFVGIDFSNNNNLELLKQLSFILAQQGIYLTILDMDNEYPLLNSFRSENGSKAHKTTDLITETHERIYLIALNHIVENMQNPKMVSSLTELEGKMDLILITCSNNAFSKILKLPEKAVDEYILCVPPMKNRMLDAYRSIKTILMKKPAARIGILITEANRISEPDAVFGKLREVVAKFLNKEIYKYGYLFDKKIASKQSNEPVSNEANSFADCISNIAQVILFRLKSNLPFKDEKPFFEQLISNIR